MTDRDRIIDWLRTAGPSRLGEIAAGTGIGHRTVSGALSKMAPMGRVVRASWVQTSMHNGGRMMVALWRVGALGSTPPVPSIVAKAIAARTVLERAWAGAAP